MKKKIFVAFLSAIILVMALSASAFADARVFTISMKYVEGEVGDIVEVPIEISNNPGIISINATLTFDDEKLQLLEIVDGGILGDEIRHQDALVSPYTLSWANYTTDQATKFSFKDDGILCTLKFRILKAEDNEYLPIDISLPEEGYGVMDFDLNDINTFANGNKIFVTVGGEYKPVPVVLIIVLIVAVLLVLAAAYYFVIKTKKLDLKKIFNDFRSKFGKEKK